ncbi:MAG: AAA family ATPase [Bacteroidota bacterium]
MKKLPISTHTFQKIINREMIYVDKTRFVWKLAEESNNFKRLG